MKRVVNLLFVVVLLAVFVCSSITPVHAQTNDPSLRGIGCESQVAQIKASWQSSGLLAQDIPDTLLSEYNVAVCSLAATVELATWNVPGASVPVSEIVAAQKEYVRLKKQVLEYITYDWRAQVGTTESIKAFLRMATATYSPPSDLQVTEANGQYLIAIPSTPTIQAVVDAERTRLVLQYENFTVIRSCGRQFEAKDAAAYWGCPVVWAVEFRGTGEGRRLRAFNYLAMVEYNWTKPGLSRGY